MNPNNFYVDFHCHPAMKPYGKSFKGKSAKKNDPNRQRKSSIWHYNPPTLVDKVLNYVAGLTKFSQSNISALAYGEVRIISASLYPLEKGFVCNKLGKGLASDLLSNLVTGLSKKRIDHLQAMKDYFTDLEDEYQYYRQLSDRFISLEGGSFRYKLVSGFDEILNDLSNQANDTVYIILSIEGAHVFNTGLDANKDTAKVSEVLANIKKVKNWPHPPFFITLAHHFYNEICGHAKSLSGFSNALIDQSRGMDSGFTELGMKVVRSLLDNEKGRRIYIDIKHMSAVSRKAYFDLLDSEYQGEDIPIIVSHGAVNGLKSLSDRTRAIQTTAGKFREVDINFFDDEIVKIARSNGMFCLQLDERRVASEAELKNASGQIKRREIFYYRSRLLWNQIQHIVEVLDKENLFAWGNMAFGSDFDGIIDPLNGFWTAEELPFLEENLSKHAYNYMNDEGQNLQNDFNKIKATEIVSRIMCDNGLAFLERYFTRHQPVII